MTVTYGYLYIGNTSAAVSVVKQPNAFTAILSHYSTEPSSLGYLTACFLIW